MTLQAVGSIVIGAIWGAILTMLASRKLLVGARMYAVVALMLASAVVWGLLS